MLFGKAAPAKPPNHEDNGNTPDIDKSANDEDLDVIPSLDIDEEQPSSGRTGRKPHTDYHAIDNFIAHEKLKSGSLCPEKCGGKVYDFEPQVIIRINGQMHACANRYTIDTKRCNLILYSTM